MTYLVSVSRKEDSEDFIVTVYNTELKGHLRTAFNLKGEHTDYSKSIGNSITWAIGILEREAKRLIKQQVEK